MSGKEIIILKNFIKIPAGSIIYAKGRYDNTASLSNPNPTMVQSGFNTEDEMFVFVFNFFLINLVMKIFQLKIQQLLMFIIQELAIYLKGSLLK